MVDHVAVALEALQAAHDVDLSAGDTALSYEEFYLREAAIHAQLAQVEVLHEIAHQLRPAPRCSAIDPAGQRCRLAPDHEGDHRVGLGGH